MTLYMGSNNMTTSKPVVIRDQFNYGCDDMRVLVNYVDEDSRYYIGANRAAPTIDQGPCAPWLQPGLTFEDFKHVVYYPTDYYRGQVGF